MSDKKKKTEPVKSEKGKGNQATKRRKAAKEHKKQKDDRDAVNKPSEKQGEASLTQSDDTGTETSEIPSDIVSDSQDNDENLTQSADTVIEDRSDEDAISGTDTPVSETTPEDRDDVITSSDTSAVEAVSSQETIIDDQSADEITETPPEDEVLSREGTSDQVLETTPVISSDRSAQPISDNMDEFLEGAQEQEILPLDVDEDEASTPVGRFVKYRISNLANAIDLRKILLPYESHLQAKMVIYFNEGQIFLGLFVILVAIASYFIWSIPSLLFAIGLSGLFLMVTGYASEELHITNYRIFIRRMNWVDRMFRIPRDSQYIIDEIVAFEIQRAPINQSLFASGLLPLLLFVLQPVRSSMVLAMLIMSISVIAILASQRLGKRTLSFLMSGGHQVHLGQYKGIPNDVVEVFTEIVMERNIFQSDEY